MHFWDLYKFGNVLRLGVRDTEQFIINMTSFSNFIHHMAKRMWTPELSVWTPGHDTSMWLINIKHHIVPKLWLINYRYVRASSLFWVSTRFWNKDLSLISHKTISEVSQVLPHHTGNTIFVMGLALGIGTLSSWNRKGSYQTVDTKMEARCCIKYHCMLWH